MIPSTTRNAAAFATGVALLLGACGGGDQAAAPEPGPTALLSVVPHGGAMGVDPSEPVTIEFGHPIMPGMELYVRLHVGGVEGPVVPGAWTLSEDGTGMTFMPESGLMPNTLYTLHLGGGMMDLYGHHVDLDTHGHDMGGDWAMDHHDGMGTGMGMHDDDDWSDHMGDGWRHPSNGSYGMVFPFTTGNA